MEPITLTIKEAATALGLSRYTVYKLLDEGKITGGYAGKRRLVHVDSLKAYAKDLPAKAAS